MFVHKRLKRVDTFLFLLRNEVIFGIFNLKRRFVFNLIEVLDYFGLEK
jgi:hypothetical protein